MRPSPVLSVGMPVRNGARWIEEAIDSILTQGFHNFELVVSDNASTDRTEAIVMHAAGHDNRIRYIRQPVDIGPYRNHDAVLQLATGRYFKWASSNDVCLDGLFERCVAALEATPDSVVAYAKMSLLDASGERRDYDDELGLDVDSPSVRFRHYLDRVRLNTPFHGVIRRAALHGTALNLPLRGSDISLMAELTLRGRFIELPDRLLVRRFTSETTDLLRSGSGRGPIAGASRRDRAVLHLRRFAIPARAPVSVHEKARVYATLLRRTAGMGVDAAASVVRRAARRL